MGIAPSSADSDCGSPSGLTAEQLGEAYSHIRTVALNIDTIVAAAQGRMIDFEDRIEMGLTDGSGAAAFLKENGREGLFLHYTPAEYTAKYGADLNAMIAFDNLQGMYVATDTGAWVRQADTLTPYMFGGQTNYKYGKRSTMIPPYGESKTPGIDHTHLDHLVLIDSRIACQEMIDLIVAHRYHLPLKGDFSGGLWGITKRGDGGIHDLNGLIFDVPQDCPATFIGGEFRGIGAGDKLFYLDELAYSKLEGKWHVRSGADGGYSYGYAIRQWNTGIWVRNSAMGAFDEFKVSGFKRWGIEYDPEYSDVDYNNNIGLRWNRVYGNNNGSAWNRNGFNYKRNFINCGRTGAIGGFNQRTWLELDGPPGDLQIDDEIRAPTGSLHKILEIVGNTIHVFPWVIIADGTAGEIISCHGGAMRVRGKDVAGSGANHLTGITNGCTLDITQCLHGTSWGDVILEGGGLGMIIGTINGVSLGHTIGHMHSEGNSHDLVSIGSANVGLTIGGVSAWAAQDYNDPFKLVEILSPNQGLALATDTGLPEVTIFIGGEWISTGQTLSGSSNATKSRAYAPMLSNNPGTNRVRKVQAVGAPTNITLKYYEKTDRFARDCHVAHLEIVGSTGGAPAEAITVTLDAADVAAGITFLDGATTYSLMPLTKTVPLGPVHVEFWLDTNGATKKWVPVIKQGLNGSGVYIPSITSIVPNNIANGTITKGQYSRNGNIVNVTVSGNVDIVSASMAGSFVISLPIPSNIAGVDVIGVATFHGTTQFAERVYGNASQDRAQVLFGDAGLTDGETLAFTMTFQYEIK